MAIAALTFSILGFTLLPLIGALLGAGLGAAALAQLRRQPGKGRGLALAAVVMGLLGSVIPLTVYLFISSRPYAGVGFALVFAFGVAVSWVAFRATTRREKATVAAGFLGGSAMLVFAFVLSVLAALGLIWSIKWLVRYTSHQIRCTVTQVAHPDPTCPTPSGRSVKPG